MRAVALIAATVLLVTVAAEQEVVSNGAICENKASGFFVMDNTALTAVDSIVYKDTSEDDCLKTCSQNRDQFGRSILCSSFVYDHNSFSCTIYKDKSKPIGQGETSTAVGKRLFEKVCLRDEVPRHCVDSQYIRVDNHVLAGYAEEVSLLETLEECVSHCAKNSSCKSAMYFYEEKECIVNTESALSKPEGFNKEDNDKVIYFQNGCPEKNNVQVDPPVLPVKTEIESTSAKTAEENSEEAEGSSESAEQLSTEAATTITERVSQSAETKEQSIEDTEQTPSTTIAVQSTELDEDTEFTSTSSASEEIPVLSAEEEEETDGFNEDEEAETESPVIRKVDNDKFDLKSSIKFKKHPRNFGSKTIKAAKSAELKESGDFLTDDFGEDVEPLSQENSAEPVEAETKPLKGKKKNQKKHKAVREEEIDIDEDTMEFPNYFSEWSDWTPCTKAGERQIRRRKCINLRKCLGALMQVQNCPAVLATPAPGPIESVRSIVGATDYDEAQAPRSSPNLPPVPVQTDGPVWSPWLGTCQRFAAGQPCNEGQMIGFESRECVAKEPTTCVGPFFRYCTLPC